MTIYRIIFRKRALQEYIKTVAWYKQRGLQVSESFAAIIQVTTNSIAESPYLYRNKYKHFYEVKTKRFPFLSLFILLTKTRSLLL